MTPCVCSSDAAAINESDEEESPLPPRSDSSVGRQGIARSLSTTGSIRVDPELAAQGLMLPWYAALTPCYALRCRMFAAAWCSR